MTERFPPFKSNDEILNADHLREIINMVDVDFSGALFAPTDATNIVCDVVGLFKSA